LKRSAGKNQFCDYEAKLFGICEMLQAVKDTFRLLTFRITREEMLNFNRNHLIFGLLCALIVGIGRYWDNQRVEFLQHLGVGSVIYVFALSLFLWLLIAPLKPKDWSYFKVLTFVSLVSPPAILYSIPVELFTDMPTANAINAWFLLIVSVWRVSLLIFFLKRFAQLSWVATVTSAILPLNIIIVSLVVLNLEIAVFNIMGGIDDSSPSQVAYGILGFLSFLSVLIFPICLIVYLGLIFQYNFRKTDLNSLRIDDESKN
jgi:hypothetical protein